MLVKRIGNESEMETFLDALSENGHEHVRKSLHETGMQVHLRCFSMGRGIYICAVIFNFRSRHGKRTPYCTVNPSVLCLSVSPGNLSHFRANLETNCNSFYFSTVLFYEVPRMTY